MEEHKPLFQIKVLLDDSEVSECLNNFFRDAVKQLGIKENVHLLNLIETAEDSIDTDIEKFKFHPSILKIQ